MHGRLNYIHSFRALAILFIVAGHAIDIFTWNSIDKERFFRILISNGSALFVFIAGYLFQHLLSKFNTANYFKNKIKNVLVPYFIVSVPALFMFTFVMHRPGMDIDFYQRNIFEQILLFLINGSHLSPFWFVPMISIFYLIGPALRILDSKSWFYYSLPVFIGISCMVSRGNPLDSFIHFFSLYMLGMVFSHHKQHLNPLISKWNIILILYFAAAAFVLLEFYTMQETMTWMNFIQKSLLSIACMGLLINLNDRVNNSFINKVADYSFGIFFIHSYFVSLGKLIYQKINGVAPEFNFIIYVLSVIAVFAICMTVIGIVKKIFGARSRYLIGS